MGEYHYDFPSKLVPILNRSARYKVAWGGRGSAKSWSFARAAILKTAWSSKRVLCTREIQNSIRESVYQLLIDQITLMQLGHRFEIYSDSIYSKSGAEMLFKGMQDIDQVKSIEAIDIAWMEEANKASKKTWEIFPPSIRKEASEIWVGFNPEDEDDPTYVKFLGPAGPPPDSLVINVNWWDNPWFPEVLRGEMEHMRATDYDLYLHVWEGKCRKHSHALVFKGKFRVSEFETPENAQFYFGEDFGFSEDPTCLIRCFIAGREHDSRCPTGCRSQHLRLFIDWEAYGRGVELSDLHRFNASVPLSVKWPIRADSARPDTISFLKRPSKDTPPVPGYNMISAEKGKNSVEDGVQFLRSFEEIVIHPRCKGTIHDFSNYKWKVDKVTGEVLPILVDKDNHAPDAVRYALEPYIKSKVTIYDVPNWGRMK